MSHAANAHLSMQLIAQLAMSGEIPSDEDLRSLKIVRAYCNAIIEGERLDAAEIWNRAFGDKKP